jgi:ferric-dicitrate binding protein FerR (iron transport regulator)
MKEDGNDIDVLLSKVLAGEATVEEQHQVEAWLQLNADNQKYYYNLKLIFDKAASSAVSRQFDEDAAWQQVKSKLTIHHKPKEQRFLRFDWRIAAAVATIVGVASLFYITRNQTTKERVITTLLQTKGDTLPDGSSVFLNQKSELTFALVGNSRKVKLKGEAFFQVKHEKKQPFIIEAEEVLVRDIGTEFNLKAYPGKDTVEIVVTEGEVQFYTLKNSGLNLKAGESARYLKKLKEFQRIDKPDTNVLAYKTNVLNFNNTDLASVIKLLNELYHTHIVLAPGLADCRLTAHFNENNPATIIEVIAETMGFTIVRKKEEVLLDGTGCNPQ